MTYLYPGYEVLAITQIFTFARGLFRRYAAGEDQYSEKC
jgi:hypothetical protein